MIMGQASDSRASMTNEQVKVTEAISLARTTKRRRNGKEDTEEDTYPILSYIR